MPFQALPIALRQNTGDPISKLAWVYIVQNCSIDDAPNGMGFIELEVQTLALFCQCSPAQAVAAVERLEILALVGAVIWKGWGDDSRRDEAFIDVSLPMTQLQESERRRIKASPDQVQVLLQGQAYQCVTCGFKDYSAEIGEWHVDHIIPRALGGADLGGNCQVICSTCNSRKGAKVHFIDYLSGRRK